MAPFYEEICAEMGWQLDTTLLEQMKEANQKELTKMQESVEDAEKNLGETEVRDFMIKKAEYYCRIGAKVFLSFSYVFYCLLFISRP